MINHTGLQVSDPVKSGKFYSEALAAIGYKLLVEVPKAPKADFWLHEGSPNLPRVHVAFRADTREQVDEFHRAALRAGGKDNGAPGPRPQYHANYYGAFVLDPDGHNIEVVWRLCRAA